MVKVVTMIETFHFITITSSAVNLIHQRLMTGGTGGDLWQPVPGTATARALKHYGGGGGGRRRSCHRFTSGDHFHKVMERFVVEDYLNDLETRESEDFGANKQKWKNGCLRALHRGHSNLTSRKNVSISKMVSFQLSSKWTLNTDHCACD